MTLQASSQAQLRQHIEQIERLEAEKHELGEDIKQKYLEAKAMGFDPKIMKKCINVRKKPKADHEEEQAILDTYLHALGMASAPMDFEMKSAADRETEDA